MEAITIKVSTGLLATVFKLLKSFYFKMWNLLFRAKIRVEFKPHIIQLSIDDKEYHAWCLAIKLTPTTDIKIKANGIKFNNEPYTYLFQGLASIVNKDHNSELLRFFKDNWLDIVQGTKCIDAKKYEQLVLPRSMVDGYANFLTKEPKKPMLFNSTKKLSIYLGINDKIFCYGLNLKQVHSLAIKHLSYRLESMKTITEPSKGLVL